MDRIEAMRIFISALDEGSLAAAGRRLGRSPAAVSRAIAFLEDHVGIQLLYRTTRSIRLSEAGERYAAACRRIMTDLEEADIEAAGERSAPRGSLSITAPVVSGEKVLRPIVDGFLDAHPKVAANLLLLDRSVSLIDEGIDVGLRLAHLPDSSLIAIRVGEVKRVVVASPQYLADHPKIAEPTDLAEHRIITVANFGVDTWTFQTSRTSGASRAVQFKPRLVVNSVRAAVDSAVAGHGITRVFSYHVAEAVKKRTLSVVLAEEAQIVPVHIITPEGRLSVPKDRAFVDFAVPRLKAAFTALAV